MIIDGVGTLVTGHPAKSHSLFIGTDVGIAKERQKRKLANT